MKPTLDEARELSRGYPCIPVSRTLYADIRTPIEALRILKRVSRHCYLLESREDATRWGRYSFLGYDPRMGIACTDGVTRIDTFGRGTAGPAAGAMANSSAPSTTIVAVNDPADILRNVLADNRSPRIPGLPPFTGGLVGYFAYDYIKYSEPKLRLDADDQENFKDVDLMLFDRVIAFDHLEQRIVLIVNIRTDDLERNYEAGRLELERMARLIIDGAPAGTPQPDAAARGCCAPLPEPAPLRLKEPFRPLMDEAAYGRMVERAKAYIYEGDIFQVVLSNRLEAEAEGSLFDTYRVLRTTNPSPYMFYFSSDDIEIAGASPETLVKLQDGVLHTFPLAGTRPRGRDDAEDARFEQELLSDPKELAEHNMLVDLGRNDLGKISRFGSVTVERHLSIERFSHVMHIGSTVRGEIRDGCTALDAVRAVLPAGTLSGAPKIRACEIINELENNKRGIYGGAIGYIDFTGNLDTCIAIRIAFKKNGKVFVRSGAGIVADSDPAAEYRECLNKARAVVNALTTAEGGIGDRAIAVKDGGPAATRGGIGT